jgi:hypothetical protein
LLVGYDNASPGPINPIPVTTTISEWSIHRVAPVSELIIRQDFRGLQANYTFPVGYDHGNFSNDHVLTMLPSVTTLSWWASTKGNAAGLPNGDVEVKVNSSISRRTPAAVNVMHNLRGKHSRLHHDH